MMIRGHTIRLVPRRPRDGPQKKFHWNTGYHKLILLIQVKSALFAHRVRFLWRTDRLPVALCFWIVAAMCVSCWAVIYTFAAAVSGLLP